MRAPCASARAFWGPTPVNAGQTHGPAASSRGRGQTPAGRWSKLVKDGQRWSNAAVSWSPVTSGPATVPLHTCVCVCVVCVCVCVRVCVCARVCPSPPAPPPTHSLRSAPRRRCRRPPPRPPPSARRPVTWTSAPAPGAAPQSLRRVCACVCVCVCVRMQFHVWACAFTHTHTHTHAHAHMHMHPPPTHT